MTSPPNSGFERSDHVVIDDVHKSFQLKAGQYITVDGRKTGEVTALAGVRLNIREGEFVAIVGPSGSGKSVLLDIIGGLTQASAGAVLIDGKRMTAPHPTTSYVFQSYALFPWRSALGNIEYTLEIRGVAKDERRRIARHYLKLFGLSAFEDRFPNELSGGMRQRIAIARALASKPKVLLMDEPFAALDAQTRDIMQAELLRVWSDIRTTVVFVTHSLEEAIYLADRVVVMTARPGRIKEVFEIDLPRPRDADIRTSTEFNGYRQQMGEVLRDEVDRTQRKAALSADYAA
ncbi:MAG TPA: ABC transporter ATP-binding protein [Xanthobacteraceae bacterium]|jgi:NitT/TauT family transport system ATP-binding protein|nr:ABC transporter ATP-binding protein [Xanthobacteraceae bacterium]